MQCGHGRFWVITSYYNPSGYKQRLLNFQEFRRHLPVPLLTVELGLHGQFELPPDCADILVKVSGGSIMWQKERLLNIALSSLPETAEYVAWLDCDILFKDVDWVQKAIDSLDEHKLIQLFSTLTDLSPHEKLWEGARLPPPSGHGIVHLTHINKNTDWAFHPNNSVDMRHAAFGLAWAARVALLKECGFYEAMVLGSGDRALACAAFSRYSGAIEAIHLGSVRADHYMNWATKFNNAVGGKIGFLEGDLYHLWHGELYHRQYAERHRAFAKLGFDPSRDLHADPFGPLEWAHRADEFNNFAKQYFDSRLEDGHNEL